MRISAVAALLCFGLAGPASAAPVLWDSGSGGNDHYYEWVQAAVTWDQANAAAAAASHNGHPGYLATVTSAAEQAFIYSNVTQSISWLGGTDRDVEGVWEWESGPEAGTIFYGPGAPVGAFAFWAAGEPNDCCGGEDELVFAWGAGGSWNDIGTPAFPTYAVGYVVEYGGDDNGSVPEPSTLVLAGAGLIGITRRWLRRR